MLRRWLSRLISLLSLTRARRAAGNVARVLFAIARNLNPSALYGLLGLGLIFGGLACWNVPLACIVTGVLMFRDATRPEPTAGGKSS